MTFISDLTSISKKIEDNNARRASRAGRAHRQDEENDGDSLDGSDTDADTGTQPASPQAESKKKSGPKFRLALDDGMCKAEDWIRSYNQLTARNQLKQTTLLKLINVYNQSNPKNTHRFETRHGELLVKEDGLLALVNESHEKRGTINEDRKKNISYASLRKHFIIREKNNFYELCIARNWNFGVNTENELLDHLNQMLVLNEGMRDANSRYQLITVEELRRSGIVKPNIIKIGAQGSQIHVQSPFIPTHILKQKEEWRDNVSTDPDYMRLVTKEHLYGKAANPSTPPQVNAPSTGTPAQVNAPPTGTPAQGNASPTGTPAQGNAPSPYPPVKQNLGVPQVDQAVGMTPDALALNKSLRAVFTAPLRLPFVGKTKEHSSIDQLTLRIAAYSFLIDFETGTPNNNIGLHAFNARQLSVPQPHQVSISFLKHIIQAVTDLPNFSTIFSPPLKIQWKIETTRVVAKSSPVVAIANVKWRRLNILRNRSTPFLEKLPTQWAFAVQAFVTGSKIEACEVPHDVLFEYFKGQFKPLYDNNELSCQQFVGILKDQPFARKYVLGDTFRIRTVLHELSVGVGGIEETFKRFDTVTSDIDASKILDDATSAADIDASKTPDDVQSATGAGV